MATTTEAKRWEEQFPGQGAYGCNGDGERLAILWQKEQYNDWIIERKRGALENNGKTKGCAVPNVSLNYKKKISGNTEATVADSIASWRGPNIKNLITLIVYVHICIEM